MAWLPFASYWEWADRRKELARLQYERQVADEKARAALAPSRAKAEIEWDMRWANPLDKTWRDELITVIFGVPIVAFFLPIPGLHDFVLQGFASLKEIDPSLPQVFVWGWVVIFGSTFGIKQFKSLFLPSKLGNLVRALGEVRDDVSQEDTKTAEDAASPATPDGSNSKENL